MAKISPVEDGPLVVEDASGIAHQSGAEIDGKAKMFLCRCGASKNKPFCDGSHKVAGFQSTNDKAPEGRDRVVTYEGADRTIHYNPQICSHAAFCVTQADHIFRLGQKPWADPDAGTAEEVDAILAACPSGALWSEAGHLDADRPTVVVQKNGPYWITDAEIGTGVSGEGGSARKYVLCRCGHSGNKPFCDGSHYGAGWSDD